MNTQPFEFSPDVEEYLLLNGFCRIDSKGTLANGMAFVKDDKLAILFQEQYIDVKEARPHDKGTKLGGVLFNWKTIKRFDGFDGKNIFHLMMLLHIMGVITIKEAIALEKKEAAKITTRIDNTPKLNLPHIDIPLINCRPCLR